MDGLNIIMEVMKDVSGWVAIQTEERTRIAQCLLAECNIHNISRINNIVCSSRHSNVGQYHTNLDAIAATNESTLVPTLKTSVKWHGKVTLAWNGAHRMASRIHAPFIGAFRSDDDQEQDE